MLLLQRSDVMATSSTDNSATKRLRLEALKRRGFDNLTREEKDEYTFLSARVSRSDASATNSK
jgi:hypothetical protein